MDIRRSVREPRSKPYPALQTNQQEEKRDPDPRRKRRPPVAGKDGHQRAEHPARRLLGKKQVAELLRVEAEDEAAERSVAGALAPREAAESPNRQIALGEAVSDCLR